MDPTTIKYLTQDETRRLFKAASASKRDEAILRTAYAYGLRASEVASLERSDVDFDRQRIFIKRVKGSISGEYPLRPEVRKALKRYLRTRDDDDPALFVSNRRTGISRRMLDVIFKRYAEEAGLPEDKRHMHVLKHSIATHLLESGQGVEFVRDWIGHKNIQNTMIYAQLSNRVRDEQARKAFASGAVVS